MTKKLAPYLAVDMNLAPLFLLVHGPCSVAEMTAWLKSACAAGRSTRQCEAELIAKLQEQNASQ